MKPQPMFGGRYLCKHGYFNRHDEVCDGSCVPPNERAKPRPVVVPAEPQWSPYS